ncbi:sporulation protein YqfD, partial [Bacteroidales bacterium MSK.15.36]|nr:sporulation protein YqfD [Bacteroidales bacterium MSK.15.36]
KKIFLKKTMNKFKQYDKIEDNKGPITFETYYEVKENKINLDKDSLVGKVAKELEEKITLNFDKNVIVKDKIIEKNDYKDYIEVRLLIVAEENIAKEAEMEEDMVTEPKEN